MANQSHKTNPRTTRGVSKRDTSNNRQFQQSRGAEVSDPLNARGRPGETTRAAGGSSKSLQKAIRILLHMGEHGPEMGVTQIASALSLNKATVHRLLSAMEKFALIERSDSDRYRLGLKLHELGTRAIESRTLRTEAHRFLLELSRASRETVSLAVPGPGGVLCLDRVNSRDSIITVPTRIGARFPAHCAAVAKAALAYLPEREVDSILSITELTPYTPFTMRSVAEVKKNLREVAERGYALDSEEFERGVKGVAAPIRTREGRVIAAVGMAGPSSRFRGKELAQKIALTKEVAEKISASLGERAPTASGS
jgi:IclR family transcriptional regulator, KDG regulon repressor